MQSVTTSRSGGMRKAPERGHLDPLHFFDMINRINRIFLFAFPHERQKILYILLSCLIYCPLMEKLRFPSSHPEFTPLERRNLG
jgi:hypothetical protein